MSVISKEEDRELYSNLYDSLTAISDTLSDKEKELFMPYINSTLNTYDSILAEREKEAKTKREKDKAKLEQARTDFSTALLDYLSAIGIDTGNVEAKDYAAILPIFDYSFKMASGKEKKDRPISDITKAELSDLIDLFLK